MEKVIGLHFWEEKAEISWCDGDSIVTGAIEMPYDIRKTSILRLFPSFWQEKRESISFMRFSVCRIIMVLKR